MLKLFSLRSLPWLSGADGQEKVGCANMRRLSLITSVVRAITIFKHMQVILSAVEVASLRSEIADAEEREAYLKAQ